MQNPQDGLQVNFPTQHSDRAVQKDNYQSEREGNKNHEFSAYVNDTTGTGWLQSYLNTWQEFVHPDFDAQVDVRAEHPLALSNMATDHIRAVFEKANQAISQHRYLNLPTNVSVDGETVATGLNFTQMMMVSETGQLTRIYVTSTKSRVTPFPSIKTSKESTFCWTWTPMPTSATIGGV